MFASASRERPTCSRQQSQRTTRRTPDGSSTGFQPVSSQMGQGILVQPAAKLRRSPELVFRLGFDLPDAFACQVQPVADRRERQRFVVVEAEAETDHLALAAVEVG